MPDCERDPLEWLNDRLDTLIDGAAGVADGVGHGTDPGDAELIRTFTHLRRLDVGQPIDGELARHIWEELTNEATLSQARPLAVARAELSSGVNGRATPQPWRASLLGPPAQRARGGSLHTQAATLLLVAVAILAVFVSVGQTRLLMSPPQGPTLVADDPGARLFTTIVAPDRAAGPLELAFWRGAIAPGTQVSAPSDWAAHPGTEVEVVLGGTLVLQADAPLRVQHAGSSLGATEIVPAGEPVRLTMGDAATIPFSSSRTYRNTGDQPAELLSVLVFTADQPVIDTMSRAEGLLIRNGDLAGVIAADVAPEGPVEITVSRLAGAENAWPAQAIRRDGVVEWRLLESLGAADAGVAEEEGGTVYVLTVGPASNSSS